MFIYLVDKNLRDEKLASDQLNTKKWGRHTPAVHLHAVFGWKERSSNESLVSSASAVLSV